MKHLIILFSFLMAITSIAQSDDTSKDDSLLYYSMKFDYPQFTMLAGGISYDFSLNGYNTTLCGFGLDAIFMHPKFKLDFFSRYHLLENITNVSAIPEIESVYEPEHSMDIDLNGTYYFNTKSEKVDQRVKLKFQNDTTFVAEIRVKQETRYGLDLGYSKGFTYYNFGDNSVIGIDPEGNSMDLEELAENRGIASYFSQSTVRFGLSLTKAVSFGAVFDTYGDRLMQKTHTFYFHGIFGMNQELDDVLASDPLLPDDSFVRYEINSEMPMSKVGVAIGYESYNLFLTKFFGFGLKAEIGLMPGPAAIPFANGYANIKLRCHLGNNF